MTLVLTTPATIVMTPAFPFQTNPVRSNHMWLAKFVYATIVLIAMVIIAALIGIVTNLMYEPVSAQSPTVSTVTAEYCKIVDADSATGSLTIQTDHGLVTATSAQTMEPNRFYTLQVQSNSDGTQTLLGTPQRVETDQVGALMC